MSSLRVVLIPSCRLLHSFSVHRMISIEEVKKKRILITGGTSGIGLKTARILSQGKNVVIVTGRDRERLERNVKEMRDETEGAEIHGYSMDLMDIRSTREVTMKMNEIHGPFDQVIMNAGTMYPEKKNNKLDIGCRNIEDTFIANVAGHYVMARVLLSSRSSDHPKIQFVSLTSVLFKCLRTIPSTKEGWYRQFKKGLPFFTDGFLSYGRSKAANIVLSNYLNTQDGAVAISVNPGNVRTGLIDRMPIYIYSPLWALARLRPMHQSMEECAETVIACTMQSNQSPNCLFELKNGKYVYTPLSPSFSNPNVLTSFSRFCDDITSQWPTDSIPIPNSDRSKRATA